MSVLNRNIFFVKEHARAFKAANNYDILDPADGKIILHCREEKLGLLTKVFRFTDYKRMTPFDIAIKTPEGQTLIQVKRGISLFLSKVVVFDGAGKVLGGFQQKFFSIGGKFDVLDAQDNPVCTLKGKWSGWDFQFLQGDKALAKVTKKWAGLGKELFTTADNYILEIDASVPADDPRRSLILAAVMCIDMVLKE